MENLEIIFLLLGLVALLAILSDRYRFPLPIVLVVVGLAISFIPGLPLIVLDPEVVFLLFLPPLLYSAAWYTDWREFRENLRPILLAGVGLVFFTTVVVAWAARSIVPSLSWAEAFLLGAIVSPPDAVAATSVTKGLGIHKRIIAIMEGESLINDAAGLVAYRYALAAVLTGTFGIWEAGLQFLWVAGAGVALGIVVGRLILLLHKHLTDNPVIETSLTLLSPYIAYLLAEHWHISGVLAVVALGLYLTGRASSVFGTQSRLHTYAVWDVLVFILNGSVFILIGLQLKYILNEIASYSLLELMGYGLAVSLIVIVVRFVWVYPAAYLPRWLSPKIRKREYFEHGYVFLFAWSGMRGVVSMAAALALPLTVNGSQPFPNRSLILFLTFAVILATLVIQGLTLRPIIKWLRIKPYSIMDEEFKTRSAVANALIAHIEENLSFGEVSDQVLAQVKSKYELKAQRLNSSDISGHQTDSVAEIFNQIVTVQLGLIEQERKILHQLRREHKANDEIVRKIEHELDLEEARLRAEVYAS